MSGVGAATSAVFTVTRRPDEQVGWIVHNTRLDILNLKPGGNAEKAGLQVGMKIRAVNDVSVRTVDQLYAIIQPETTFTVKVDIPQPPGSPQAQAASLGPNPLESYRHSQANDGPLQYVTVQGLLAPQGLRYLNGQRGVLMEVRRYKQPPTALVRFVGSGVHELPVHNLHYQNDNLFTDVDDPFHNLKFPPGIEEIVVETQGSDIIGLQLDRMVLTGVRKDTPADVAKAAIYIGWRLTHVNGIRVVKTEDVPNAAQGSNDVVLRFEIEEITVRKHPNEVFGLELGQDDLVVVRATPGTPAAQYDLGERFKGYVLTHINGFRVAHLGDVAALVMGCDSVRVRFEPAEIIVNRREGENLGMKIEGMVLTGSLPGSATKRQGVDKFLGRRLTHVNLHPVTTIEDIRRNITNFPLGRTAEGDEMVALRFEIPTGEEENPPLLQSYAQAPAAGPPTHLGDDVAGLLPAPPAAQQQQQQQQQHPAQLSPPNRVASEVYTTPTYAGGSSGFRPRPSGNPPFAQIPGGGGGAPLGAGSPAPAHAADYAPFAPPMTHPIRVPPGYYTQSPTGGITNDPNPYAPRPYDVTSGVERPSKVAAHQGKMDRLLYDLRLDREERHNNEQNDRIRRLEERLAAIESTSPRHGPAASTPGAELGGPPSQGRDVGDMRALSPKRAGGAPHPASPRGHAPHGQTFGETPQGVGRQCCMCGAVNEIECRDCGLVFCAPCCAEVHKVGRLRVTHTNMVPTKRPSSARYPFGPLQDVDSGWAGNGRYY